MACCRAGALGVRSQPSRPRGGENWNGQQSSGRRPGKSEPSLLEKRVVDSCPCRLDGRLMGSLVDPGHVLEPGLFHGDVAGSDPCAVLTGAAGTSRVASTSAACPAFGCAVVVVRARQRQGRELGVYPDPRLQLPRVHTPRDAGVLDGSASAGFRVEADEGLAQAGRRTASTVAFGARGGGSGGRCNSGTGLRDPGGSSSRSSGSLPS